MKGKWVAPEFRDKIVSDVERLCEKTGVSLTTALHTLDIAKPRFFDWKRRFGDANRHNGLVPKSSWILPSEREAILKFFAANPMNGCKRLSYMMIDEDIAYVSHNTVYRVLQGAGLLDRKTDTSSLKGKGFDQPTRPHEQWHIDVSYINVGGTFYYLCSVLDGFSRFIVHWEIRASMTQADCQMILQRARELAGAPYARLISDNGPQFKAKQFKSFIKMCGMDQTFTSPYYPQSNGKIERWHRELKSNCIRVRQPQSFEEAKRFVGEFIEAYNYGRLHSAIGYVTPYDKLLGIDEELQIERRKKLTQARERRQAEWLKQKIEPTECAVPA